MDEPIDGRPLKVGVQLPEVERFVPWSELVAMARAAEEIGLDSVWVGDHLVYKVEGEEPRGPWESWSMLAGLAVATKRIEFGPLVACTSFHNPAMIAKKAATIDEMSGGRLQLGLGSGWNRSEYDAYGFPFDHRVSRFEEAFTIIRTLLREGYVDFDGAYYQAKECPLVPRGPRPAGPPLIIGSFGERMLRITLPHVDGWNAWYADYGNTIEGLRALLERVDGSAREVGRDPATIAKSVAPYVRMTGGRGRPGGDPTERAIEPISGKPEELAAALREIAALGVSHVQLVLDPIDEASIRELAPMLALLDNEGASG